jgi:pimeloyl-ACP methyl ester carboxylesterase
MPDITVTAHDGIELAVRDHGGDGPDVLFLHGATRTLEDWAPVVQRLSGVRAVAMDLRMHGRSGVPEAIEWEDFVHDVGAVVDTLALSEPVVVGHSFGGVLAMAYAAARHGCRGAVNVDGFDFRQRELFDELDPAEVDRFLEGFRIGSDNFITPDAGDDAWLDDQRRMIAGIDAAWKIPDDVSASSFERTFVRTADGWARRPPNSFFDKTNAGLWSDPLAILGQVTCPAVYVVCRPPDESGMFAAARAGLERHVRAISADKPGVRLETIDATHGVIFEKPDEIASLVSSLVHA